MKHLVCIDDTAQDLPIVERVKKGEIYTYDCPCKDTDFLFLCEFPKREDGKRPGWRVECFRPTDDTFGEVVAEILEQQIEVEKTEKDLQTISV